MIQLSARDPGLGPQPRWDGTPIPDKTLLLHTDQGAGDAIQLARYLPLVAQRCKKLLLACGPDLLPPVATVPGLAEIRDPSTIRVVEYDAYLPLGSVPQVLGTTLATIPAAVPYLDVAALRRRQDPTAWPRLAPSPRPRVGLVWAGSPPDPPDRQRACALRDFGAVLQLPGFELYSLQQGEPRQELAQLPPSCPVRELAPAQPDVAALALLVDQLDLVLTVESAVAHLAGALGKPAWVLLSAVPAWCWGVAGETTPWYPSLRLFRQVRPGDWAGVMQRVAAALAAWRDAHPPAGLGAHAVGP